MGRRHQPLPFPHVVVGDRIKLSLPPGHGGQVGDVIEIQGRYRFRIVRVLDGGVVLARRRRWYDVCAAVIGYATGRLPLS